MAGQAGERRPLRGAERPRRLGAGPGGLGLPAAGLQQRSGADAKAYLLSAQRSRASGWGLLNYANYNDVDREHLPLWNDLLANKIGAGEYAQRAGRALEPGDGQAVARSHQGSHQGSCAAIDAAADATDAALFRKGMPMTAQLAQAGGAGGNDPPALAGHRRRPGAGRPRRLPPVRTPPALHRRLPTCGARWSS